jgi:hypothetical protein
MGDGIVLKAGPDVTDRKKLLFAGEWIGPLSKENDTHEPYTKQPKHRSQPQFTPATTPKTGVEALPNQK